MRKCLIPFFAVIILALAGCGSRYPYRELPSFPFASESERYLILPNTETETFDRVSEKDGKVFFYRSEMRGGKVDKGIEAVDRLSFSEMDVPVFLSGNALTHLSEEAFWVNPDDETRLLGAVALAFQDGESLPFGLYAGASMYLLDESPKYTGSALEKRLGKYPYCRELQYPLYTAEKTTREERETAWSFAYSVAAKWFETDTLEELFVSSPEDWTEVLSATGAELPEYKFFVGDNYYGTRAETENFFYLFPRKYIDRLYDENEFSISYPVLTDFFRENEAYLKETCSLLGAPVYPKRVTVYMGGMGGLEFLGDGGFSGYFNYDSNREPYIVCNTVYAFSHEATHYIFEYMGQRYSNPLNEAMCSFFAYRSVHAKFFGLDCWNAYCGVPYYDKFYREGRSKEQEENLTAIRKLYDSVFGKADEENFSPMKFLACMAVYNQATVEDMLPALDEYNILKQLFAQYIFETYGAKALLDTDRLWKNVEIDGKTFDELTAEWIAQLYAEFV